MKKVCGGLAICLLTDLFKFAIGWSIMGEIVCHFKLSPAKNDAHDVSMVTGVECV